MFPLAAAPGPFFPAGAALQVHGVLEGIGHLAHHAVQQGGDAAGHIIHLAAQLVLPALKAVAERVAHGVFQFVHADAQVPQLLFQLGLDGGLLFFLVLFVLLVHVLPQFPAGLYRLTMAEATRRPSTAALMMPPA